MARGLRRKDRRQMHHSGVKTMAREIKDRVANVKSVFREVTQVVNFGQEMMRGGAGIRRIRRGKPRPATVFKKCVRVSLCVLCMHTHNLYAWACVP